VKLDWIDFLSNFSNLKDPKQVSHLEFTYSTVTHPSTEDITKKKLRGFAEDFVLSLHKKIKTEMKNE
jgi:hypothetical protein